MSATPALHTNSTTNMSQRQSRYVAVVCPRKKNPSNIRLAPFTGRPIHPFRFLDLPAEIREIIYDLWIPTVLHVSLGLRGIRLQHFSETREGLCFQAISISPFLLNRQFYQEFRHALFVRSTWCFSSANLLAKVFSRIPKSTSDMIRHVSMRMITQGSRNTSASTGDLSVALTYSPFRAALHYLRQMQHLQTLLININFSDFTFKDSDPYNGNHFRDCGSPFTIAAYCVGEFTWVGLETRIPFSQNNLPKEFMHTLQARCGTTNVSLVMKHKDRYAGQMVDVVICPSTATYFHTTVGVDQTRVDRVGVDQMKVSEEKMDIDSDDP